ncbi:ROK family glucokinase [Bacillota bacterium LX-D]|nr:ROK family glucokinase [Bacillota bacterium LX-D]
MHMNLDKYAVCIDLGGTAIKGALVDGRGKIYFRQQLPTQKEKGLEHVAKQLLLLVEKLETSVTAKKNGILGIGIGIPGWVRSREGYVELAPNLGWKNINLRTFFEDKITLPIYFENDANLAALGEAWAGAGSGFSDFLFMTIGTGVGSGLIVQKKLYTGYSGFGSEIGHLQMVPKGVKCGCGNYGCLETVASATALVRRAKEEIAKGAKTALAKFPELEAKDIFTCALQNDLIAQKLVAEVADYLSAAIMNVALLLDIPLIVLGGGVSAAGDILLQPVRKMLEEKMHMLPQKIPQVMIAKLGNDAGLLGAARLVFNPEREMER